MLTGKITLLVRLYPDTIPLHPHGKHSINLELVHIYDLLDDYVNALSFRLRHIKKRFHPDEVKDMAVSFGETQPEQPDLVQQDNQSMEEEMKRLFQLITFYVCNNDVYVPPLSLEMENLTEQSNNLKLGKNYLLLEVCICDVSRGDVVVPFFHFL